jgi:hypothetical protein
MSYATTAMQHKPYAYRVKNMFFIFLLFGVLTAFGAYCAWGVYTRLSYGDAFEQTKNGESLAEVTTRFGTVGIIEGHQDATGYDWGSRSVCGGTCWLRIGYELPFSLGTSILVIDFDNNQKVINKAKMNSP